MLLSNRATVSVRAKAIVDRKLKPRVLTARSPRQQRYLNILREQNPYVVIATGCAGSGKTMLATHVGIEKLKEGSVDRIIITRPAVSVDESHGYLPGTLDDKMEPWTRPITDVLNQKFSCDEITRMFQARVIEICPLAYMRGRTFENAWIICDEAQNCTPNQMLMVLTRIGDGSKLVITGDLAQHDRGFERNGLVDFIDRIDASNPDGISMIEFEESDVIRHPIIPTILSMYAQQTFKSQ
jgi:phosphate starvation-inducible protein PhoH and related proteins